MLVLAYGHAIEAGLYWLSSRHLGSFNAKHGLPDCVQRASRFLDQSFKLDVHIFGDGRSGCRGRGLLSP
jgi:hypothetical protein